MDPKSEQPAVQQPVNTQQSPPPVVPQQPAIPPIPSPVTSQPVAQPPQPSPAPQNTPPPETIQPLQPKRVSLMNIVTVFIIVSLLLTITLLIYYIATNPARQRTKESNTLRKSAVAQIGQALTLYKAQNGQFPSVITSDAKQISKSGADICEDLVPNYIPTLPVDPSLGANKAVSWNSCPLEYTTGYTVQNNANGTVTISAPKAESREKISITE